MYAHAHLAHGEVFSYAMMSCVLGVLFACIVASVHWLELHVVNTCIKLV